MVHAEWPVQRAHRLFAALGLRHLVVLGRRGEPVGILTRHDLQHHHDDHATASRRTRASTDSGMIVQPLPPAPPPPEAQAQAARGGEEGAAAPSVAAGALPRPGLD